MQDRSAASWAVLTASHPYPIPLGVDPSAVAQAETAPHFRCDLIVRETDRADDLDWGKDMTQEHRTQFDAYRVRYLTGGDASPEIDCLSGGKQVGKLLFHRDDAPAQSNQLEDGVICLHFDLSQLPHLIDLLREEKPLYISFSEASRVGGVMTGAEPVGEGEPYLSR